MYFTLLFQKRDTLRDSAAMDRELANDFPTVDHLVFLVEAYKRKWLYIAPCFLGLKCGSTFNYATDFLFQ